MWASYRMIIAAIIGVGAGYLIGKYFGDIIVWSAICVAFALATETSLRTVQNYKNQPHYDGSEQVKRVKKPKQRPQKDADDPHF